MTERTRGDILDELDDAVHRAVDELLAISMAERSNSHSDDWDYDDDDVEIINNRKRDDN